MSATPLAAQTAGVTSPRSAPSDQLNGTLGVSAGFDSEPSVDSRNPGSANSQFAGFSTMMTGSGDYTRNNRLVSLNASGTTSFRYDERLDKVAGAGSNVALGATVTMPGRSRLDLAQTAAFYPSYVSQLFPTETVAPSGGSAPPPPGYGLDSTHSYSYGSRVGLGIAAGRRTHVTTTADYGRTAFGQHDIAPPNLATYGIGARVTSKLTRRVGLSGGYDFRSGEFGAGGTTREHSVTVGMDYTRPLSASRRATIRLDLSPTMFEVPGLLPGGIVLEDTAGATGQRLEGRQQQYRVHAGLAVGYQFRLNWQATFNYDRGLEYLAALTAPIISDTVRTGVDGRISRRLRVSGATEYSTGTSTQSLTNQDIKTYTGHTRLAFAFSRSLAAYSEYAFYYYDTRAQPGLTPGLPNRFKQHSVRAGVSLVASRKGVQ